MSRRVDGASESDTGLLTTAINRTNQVSKVGRDAIHLLPQRQTFLPDFSLVPCVEQAEITLQTTLVNDLKRSGISHSELATLRDHYLCCISPGHMEPQTRCYPVLHLEPKSGVSWSYSP